jgi:hypothetical protein
MHYLSARNALLAVSTALATVAFVAPAQAAEGGPFSSVYVAANRSQYSGGGCPIGIIYTGNINFFMPHPRGFVFNYHWERSDGAKGPEHVVRPSPNQRSMVVRENWRIGGPGQHHNASATLFVNSGNTHLVQTSPTVSVTCR